MSKILDILTEPWLIAADKLREIQGIYLTHLRGEKIDIAAVEAQLGRPLKNEKKAYEVINGVAVIPVEGVIAKRMSLFMDISGGVSTYHVADQIGLAVNDISVKAIILNIDSPGGTVDGTQDLAETIRAASAIKPLIAFTDGMMASAAYWVGSAADAVYIGNDTTQVGSIGVVVSHLDVSAWEEKNGYKTTEVTAGRYKRLVSQYKPLSEEGKAQLQDVVDHIYGLFTDAVASARGLGTDKDDLKMWAEGQVFIGKKAITAGLVDGVSTLDRLIEIMAGGVPAMQSTKTKAQAGVPEPQNVKEKDMTLDELKKDHPEAFQAAYDEGRGVAQAEAGKQVEAAKVEAAAAERARIISVHGAFAGIPGMEELAATMMADGKSTDGDAAKAIIAKQKEMNADALNRIRASKAGADVKDGEPGQPDGAAAQEGEPTDDAIKAAWESDPKVRKEFKSIGAYAAFRKAEARGQVRILKK